MDNDLIRRSALIAALENEKIRIAIDKVKMFGLIEAAPAVDAVPVVRCKDCIYNDSETHIPGFVYCNFYDSTKDFDGYCDEGERRDDVAER